jgi:serralysin
VPTTHLTTEEAGEQITRNDLSWGSDLGEAYGPVTFGFRETAPSYSLEGPFSQLSPAEMEAAESALSLWADVANISFREVNEGGYTDDATILFGNYESKTDGAQAYTYLPGSTRAVAAAGDVWLNIAYESTADLPFGSYDFLALLHEIGHALGLEHPGDYNAGPGQVITYADDAEYVEDSRQYTIMSYFDASKTGADHVDGRVTIYPSTPLLDDIAAIQRLYGANMTTRTGNDTYGFNCDAGDAFAITSSREQVVFCIWDAGGNDTLDLFGYATDQVINLAAESFSSAGNLTLNISIAAGVTIENAIGGAGDDDITGNSADNFVDGRDGSDEMSGRSGNDIICGRAGNDVISGDDSNDRIFGGTGANSISGDDGDDRLFVIFGENTVEFSDDDGADVVVGYKPGTDHFDLTAVPGVDSFDDLTLSDQGDDVLVDYGSGTFLLKNTELSSLDASDFVV